MTYNSAMRVRHNIGAIAITCLILVFSLASCVKSAQTDNRANTENLPDMVMTNATYIFGEKGRSPVVMNAKKITIYNRETDKTELENINFHQEDEMTGSCERAVVTDNNNNARLSGNISLYKKTDNFTIMCDSLTWDNRKQVISTEGIVDVEYQDGTIIRAKGFTAKLDDNIYEFKEIIKGSYDSEK